MVIDNGVYPFTLGGIMSTLLGGYYRCPNVQIDVVEVLTHKPQAGAYRAPGAPQVTFALESSIDELARRLELDPLELRLRNAATTGDPMGNNDPWPSMGLRQVLEAAANHPLWRERTPGSGVGLAIGGWPCGVSPAAAVCRLTFQVSTAASCWWRRRFWVYHPNRSRLWPVIPAAGRLPGRVAAVRSRTVLPVR